MTQLANWYLIDQSTIICGDMEVEHGYLFCRENIAKFLEPNIVITARHKFVVKNDMKDRFFQKRDFIQELREKYSAKKDNPE